VTVSAYADIRHASASGLFFNIRCDDICALCRQTHDDAFANAVRRARDKGGLALQPLAVVCKRSTCAGEKRECGAHCAAAETERERGERKESRVLGHLSIVSARCFSLAFIVTSYAVSRSLSASSFINRFEFSLKKLEDFALVLSLLSLSLSLFLSLSSHSFSLSFSFCRWAMSGERRHSTASSGSGDGDAASTAVVRVSVADQDLQVSYQRL
jgi:hypothetical protein